MTVPNTAAPALALRAHPDRAAAVDEVHARPHVAVSPPVEIAHLAFSGPEKCADRLFRHLTGAARDAGTRHETHTLGPGLTLRWQRHTEFHTLTLFARGEAGSEWEASRAIDRHLAWGASAAEGLELLVAQRLHVVADEAAMRAKLEGVQRLVGGRIRGDVDVRTSFEPDQAGFVHYTLAANGAAPEKMGRRVARLIDVETYRIMALLALPLARRASEAITAMEAELAGIIALAGDDATPDGAILDRLTALANRAESLRAETRYRFSATTAYDALVRQRLDVLREERHGDFQTMTGFINTRLQPAVSTIQSVAQRQATLSDDLGRGLALLGTRVSLETNRANQALLASMDKRQSRQIAIQEAVEGLSTVAIAYYAVGLLAYLLAGAEKAGWLSLPYPLLVALAVPLVVAAVVLVLRRAKARWSRGVRSDG